MSARFGAYAYAAAARALMPRGPAWSDDPDSVQGRLLGALALALWRSDAAAVQLIADAFPATAGALIGEWETSVGLPDPDAPAGGADADRRAQIVARLVGAGGQSRERFIAFAASLGFTIAIETYAPLRVGRFVAGSAARSDAWSHAWGVRITANAGTLTPAQLKAKLDALRPAETTILLL